MRRVTYESVLRGSIELAGMTYPPQADDGDRWRGWIDLELSGAWEMEAWPDLMRAEKRYLRPLYNGAVTYAAGDEVYYPSERKYFLALRTTIGNVPTDISHWAEARTSYSAMPYLSALAYAVGDQVYDLDNDLIYQAHTAGTGHLPTDTGFWGQLIPFIPDIDYEQPGLPALGEVFNIWDKNPRVFTSAQRLPFTLTQSGASLYTMMPSVWIEYRIRAPRLIGEVWNAAGTYLPDEQIYYAPDFYFCVTGTAATESPITAPGKWQVIEIPYIFGQSFLVDAAYSRWLRSDGQNDKSALASVQAREQLVKEANKLFRQQGQRQRARVNTR